MAAIRTFCNDNSGIIIGKPDEKARPPVGGLITVINDYFVMLSRVRKAHGIQI